MQSAMDVNSLPIHIGMMPGGVRSLKSTRKNLIILISIVSTIVAILFISLIVISLGGDDTSSDSVVVTNADEDKPKKADDAKPKEPEKPKEPLVKLDKNDDEVIDALLEAITQATGQQRETDATVIGKNTSIFIDTIPSGAKVFNPDGSFRGTTPYKSEERFLDKTHKEQSLIIRHDDCLEMTAKFIPGEDAELELELEQDTEIKAPVKKAKKKPKRRSKPKPPQRGRRILL